MSLIGAMLRNLKSTHASQTYQFEFAFCFALTAANSGGGIIGSPRGGKL